MRYDNYGLHDNGYDTVLIADAYYRLKEAEQNNYEVDINREAEGLSMAMRALGHRHRRVAILPEHNERAETAFRRAGFQTMPMNGNRPAEIMSFISQELRNLRAAKPRHLILETADPAFDLLASSAVRENIQVSIWAPTTLPPELMNPDYGIWRLEDVIPETKMKVAKVAVYLDYENLYIGLQRQGSRPATTMLVEAVRAETADLGHIVDIYAYADWYQLAKGSGQDIQRELAMLGVKTHYQISKHGKNSADMAMVNDIHTKIQRSGKDIEAIDTVVIGSRDRDFTIIVKQAQKQGKRVRLLALREGLSNDLEQAADDVRLLDKYFDKPAGNTSTSRQPAKEASDEQFTIIMHTVVYLHQKHYKWSYTDKLAAALGLDADGEQKLRQALKDGLLKPGRPGDKNTISLDLSHPDTYLGYWIYHQLRNSIDEQVNKGKFKYIDTNFLHQKMSNDPKLKEFRVGRSWSQVKKALERAAASGVIVKKRQKHYKHSEQVDTWWLAEPAQEQSPTDTQNQLAPAEEENFKPEGCPTQAKPDTSTSDGGVKSTTAF